MEERGIEGARVECGGQLVEGLLLVGGGGEIFWGCAVDMGQWVADDFLVEGLDQLALFEPFEHRGGETGLD